MWTESENKHMSEASKMIDVAYRINCKTLPFDHAYELSKEITKLLPWLVEDKLSGIHTLHGPDSGNGWMRAEDEEIFLSQRTRLIIRMPKEKVELAKQLENQILEVLGNKIKIGKSNVKPFLVVRDLICRFVLNHEDVCENENEFLSKMINELNSFEISIKRAICGKTKSLTINGKKRSGRSLMIADLSKENAVRLQDIGVGEGRIFGCGIFLPHKSIDAVANFKED
jgi:CRISPR-associated protein Cas6